MGCPVDGVTADVAVPADAPLRLGSRIGQAARPLDVSPWCQLGRAATAEYVGTFVLVVAIRSTAVAAGLGGSAFASDTVALSGGLSLAAVVLVSVRPGASYLLAARIRGRDRPLGG
jgi:hypothetical protein